MIQGLTDLDTLCLNVRDRVSRQLIDEAITAYRNGALRAAIASTWTAVVYDIVSKAKELAHQEDSAAKTFVDDHQSVIQMNDIAHLQRIESNILNTANEDLQLLAPHEYDALRRLQKDHHICAHPAFVDEIELYQPTPEQVRAHLVHALQHLLIHAPLRGKSAIARLEVDLLSPSFPTSSEDIGKYIRPKYLDRAKDSLVANLMKGVLMVPFGKERDKFMGKERLLALTLQEIAVAKRAIYDKEVPSFVADRFKTVSDDVLLRICTFIGVDKYLWDWLSMPDQLRVKMLLENVDVKTLKAFSAFDALIVPELFTILMNRFETFDRSTKISIIAEHPRREFVSQGIKIYGGTDSHRSAEVIGKSLIVRLARHFTAEDISQLLEVAANNKQIWGAEGTSAVLESVFCEARRVLNDSRPHWYTYVDKMTEHYNVDHVYPYIMAKLKDTLQMNV